MRTLIPWIPALAATTLAALATEEPPAAELPAPIPFPAQSLWWADFDADGLDDAYVVRPDGTGRLLRGLGGAEFVDVTDRVLPAGTSGAHMAVWGDVDGDARLDLYLPSWGGASRLLLQSAEGAFIDASDVSGLPRHAAPIEATFRDIDADGDLDLHLLTEVDDLVLVNDGRGHFERIDFGLAPRLAVDPRRTARTVDEARASRGLPPAGGGATFGPGGPGAPGFGFEVVCAIGVQDQSNPSDCLNASAVPTLGMLYPLSNELYVDAGTGNVGIGTTSPTQALDVAGTVRASGEVRGSRGVFSASPPLAITSTSLVSNLNADLLDGLDSSAFATLPVTGSDILNGSLTGTDVADGSITGTDIADGSVTSADLGINSVGLAEIAPDAVGETEIVAGAVGASEIQSNAVFTEEIANGSILNVDVNASAAIAGTKIDPAFGTQDVTALGSAVLTATNEWGLKGRGVFGPTNGYVGVQGDTDFDGQTTADWIGFEIGLAGTSLGSTSADNYGVLGHSNNVGVRGEYSGDPLNDYGHLGTNNIGVLGSGGTAGVEGRHSSSSSSYGRLGTSSYGVQGEGSSAGGFFGDTAGTSLDGVLGRTSNSSGYAVWGRNSSTTGSAARGVFGQTSSSSSFGVYASGGFGGTGAKYFINPHPTDPLKEVRMVCLEGNESGTYFRGSASIANGLAVIDVPEVFRLASVADGMTVQLTPVGAPARMWVESQDLEHVIVRADVDVEFHYFVNGVRRGYEDLGERLIVDNQSYVPSPDEFGKPFGTQYPDSYRRMLVDNGILNPDFTPNEATVALMESVLESYAVRNANVRAVQAVEEAARREAAAEAARRAASPQD